MKRFKFVMPDDFNLFCFGDRHLGSQFSCESSWKKTVQSLHEPYDGLNADKNFAIDHGDILEGITIDDPRYDPLVHKDSVLKQIEDAKKSLLRIQNKLLLGLDGNHLRSRSLKRFGSVAENIYKSSGIDYGTWSSHITYVDRKYREMFRHFCTHGRRGLNSTLPDPERRRSSLESSLRKVLRDKFGDCALMTRGHTHQIITAKPVRSLYLYMAENEIKHQYKYFIQQDTSFYIPPSLRYYASTGSFFKLYGDDGAVSYAEEHDYDPLEIGYVVVKVRDQKIVGIDEVIL